MNWWVCLTSRSLVHQTLGSQRLSHAPRQAFCSVHEYSCYWQANLEWVRWFTSCVLTKIHQFLAHSCKLYSRVTEADSFDGYKTGTWTILESFTFAGRHKKSLFILSLARSMNTFFSPWIYFLAFLSIRKYIKYVIWEIRQACFKAGWKQFRIRYLCLFGKVSGTWKGMSYFELKGLNDIPMLQTNKLFLFFKSFWWALRFWAGKIWIQN